MTEHGKTAPEDVKAKFKAALERKTNSSHEPHADGSSKAHGVVESQGGTAKRMFRRKSGG